MPRYYPNNRFSDCFSSVGNITFYHKDGECYYRTKSRPIFPGTAGQLEQLDLHRRAIATWRKQPHQVQLQWNELAKGVPSKRPPFNRKTHISGYNLFVSAYHGLASTGNESIPQPVPLPVFPEIHLEFKSYEIIQDTDLKLSYKIKTLSESLDEYCIIAKLQITQPGFKPDTGRYRNHIGVIQNHTVEFTIPDYHSLNIDISSSTIHAQFCLVHNKTGYRNKGKYTRKTIAP